MQRKGTETKFQSATWKAIVVKERSPPESVATFCVWFDFLSCELVCTVIDRVECASSMWCSKASEPASWRFVIS